MSEQPTEMLIENLAQDLGPVRRLAHPVFRVLPLLALSALYSAAVVFLIGVRSDIAHKLSDLHFMFEIGTMGLAGITAALAAAWLCVPDMRGRGWVPVLPLTLIGLFAFWHGLRSSLHGHGLPDHNWDHCVIDGFILIALPAAAILWLTRRGATTRPFLMALMLVLAVTAFGYIGLRFTCVNDSVGHAGLSHVAPFALAGLAFGLLARRIYRW